MKYVEKETLISEFIIDSTLNDDNIYDIEVKHQDGTTEVIHVQPEIRDNDGVEQRVYGIEMHFEEQKGFLNSIKYAFKKLKRFFPDHKKN